MTYWCVSETYILVCVMKVCVYVCVFGRPLDLFQVEFRVLLLSPHDVNQGGVEETTPQVTLYEDHTAKS